MIWTIVLILVLLWLVGIIGGAVGWAIHLLLIAAVVIAIARIVAGPRIAA